MVNVVNVDMRPSIALRISEPPRFEAQFRQFHQRLQVGNRFFELGGMNLEILELLSFL